MARFEGFDRQEEYLSHIAGLLQDTPNWMESAVRDLIGGKSPRRMESSG